MLYVSTRNRADSYTHFRTLCEERTADGGLFVPMQFPVFSKGEICALKEKSFGETVADILNRFFSEKLNAWDVEFCIGRYPFKLVSVGHRLIVAELWRNLEESYRHLQMSLYRKLAGKEANATPTEWAQIAIGISVLFGLYGELLRADIRTVDVAVNADDVSAPMAAWYARQMGLPIGTIICASDENSTFWDLLHRGECATSVASRMGEAAGIERLIYSAFGQEEVLRYVAVCERRGVYHLNEEELERLNSGMRATVVSQKRVSGVLSNFFRSNDYITDAHTALVYGGLQDYRARTGESKQTLLLSQRSPLLEAERISGMIGISVNEIRKRIHNA